MDTAEKSLSRVSLEISGSKGQIPGFLRDPDPETHLPFGPVVTSQRKGRSRADFVVCGPHPGDRGTPKKCTLCKGNSGKEEKKQTFPRTHPADISKTKKRGE